MRWCVEGSWIYELQTFCLGMKLSSLARLIWLAVYIDCVQSEICTAAQERENVLNESEERADEVLSSLGMKF